jgi:2-phospho-L-lactate guanylyltransferase
MTAPGIWAVLPVKALADAKQRLAPLLTPAERQALARVCIAEVMDALAVTRSLAGVLVVTLDPWAKAEALQRGARVTEDGARDGHTGSVRAGIAVLAAEGQRGMLAVPGDIPAATAAEFESVLAAHPPRGPGFTIAPAHDALGSNAVLCTPPDAVPLRFGEDSYRPHLAAARRHGIEPGVVHLPGIALDIDHPADLRAFLDLPQAAATRTRAFLEASGIAARLRNRAGVDDRPWREPPATTP